LNIFTIGTNPAPIVNFLPLDIVTSSFACLYLPKMSQLSEGMCSRRMSRLSPK